MNALRLYAPDELGKDGYPSEWHRCPRCDSTGEVGNPEHPDCCGTHAGGCGGAGSIKATVRSVAGHRCVRCSHPYTKGAGEWSRCDGLYRHQGEVRDRVDSDTGTLWFEARWRILTVHHLDGDKANCRWWNLAALCQRCHLQIQGRVQMARVWPWEHSEWFKPYVAGFYAWSYLGEDLTREQTLKRLDELLNLELSAPALYREGAGR